MNRLQIYLLLAVVLLFTSCNKSDNSGTSAGTTSWPALTSNFTSLEGGTYTPTFNASELGVFQGYTGTCLAGMQPWQDAMELIVSFQTIVVNWDTSFQISNDPQKISSGEAVAGSVSLVDFLNYAGVGDTLFTFTRTDNYANVAFTYSNGVLSGTFNASLTYIGSAKWPATAYGTFSFPFP